MSIRSITNRGRRRAAQVRHRERIVIDRPTGSTIDDEGREETTYEPVYDGIGRLHTFRPHEQTPDVAAGTATVQRVDWHIPDPSLMASLIQQGRVAHWHGPVMTGDRARLVTPGVPPKTARIAGEFYATDKTEQRFIVDEITGGVWS